MGGDLIMKLRLIMMLAYLTATSQSLPAGLRQPEVTDENVQAVAQKKAPGSGIWDATQIYAAMDKARNGQPEDLMRLTSMAGHTLAWKPAKKDLQQYHKYLETNENPFVQYFAVVAVGRLKDASSVEPLQKFIMAAQHRSQSGNLNQPEIVPLQFAIQMAIAVMGEIDVDNDLSVAFLGKLLKSDIPKEFGGAVAHSALARKGRPGLQRLLEESRTLTADDRQVNYVGFAISEINDPTLVGDLYVACLNTNYPGRIRASALFAIEGMGTNPPNGQQLIIDILMNEKSDMRRCAAACVGRFGTASGRELLRKVRNAPGKNAEELIKSIDETLLQCDTENTIGDVVKAILSPTTPDAHKKRLCYSLSVQALGKDNIVRYAETIKTCLKVENIDGEPLNAGRVSIWLNLYRATGVKHPVTLAYDTDQHYQNATSEIRAEIEEKYEWEHKYSYGQPRKMAEDETRQIVTRWIKNKTGGDR